jgi:hypothetical protein
MLHPLPLLLMPLVVQLQWLFLLMTRHHSTVDATATAILLLMLPLLFRY